MYNQIFSPQWVFDRCIEGQSLFIPLNIIIFLIIILLIFLLFKKAKFTNIPNILLSTCLGIIILPVIVISSWLFGTFNCSAQYFWKGVLPAHELHAKINQYCTDHKHCPESEQEISKLDSQLFREITQNAKSKYVFDKVIGKYIWYVRPSKYYVVIFTQDSFNFYKIPNFINVKHWDDVEGSLIWLGSKSNLPK